MCAGAVFFSLVFLALTSLTTVDLLVNERGLVVKEALGGYFVLDCPTLEDALDWAARIPAVDHGGAVELRPVHTDPEA